MSLFGFIHDVMTPKAALQERTELRGEEKPEPTAAQRKQWAWEQSRRANERATCQRHPIPGLEFGKPDESADGE